ncbi:MAG: hypothetical protein IJX80_09080 [Clostridia bacterium]|nr:hypothetical protein [Clostridia bacterium]
MKRLICLLLSLICILPLAACQQPAQREDRGDTGTTAEAPTEAPTESQTPPADTSTDDSSQNEDPSEAITEEEWRALFALENVKVRHIFSDGEVDEYLIDGEYASWITEGETQYMNASALIGAFDFSEDYASFACESEGVYVAQKLIRQDRNDIATLTFENVTVELSEGRIYAISFVWSMEMNEEVHPSYEDIFLFSDWGEVTVEMPDMTLRTEDYHAALAAERFENFTMDEETTQMSPQMGMMLVGLYQFDGSIYSVKTQRYDLMDFNGVNETFDGGEQEGICLTYLHDVLAILSEIDPAQASYDAFLEAYTYDGSVTVSRLDGKLLLAEGISFMIEDGYLTQVFFSAKTYLSAEDETPAEEYSYQATLRDYGTTVIAGDTE